MKNTYVISTPAPGLKVVSYDTDRFKTGRLSFNFILPLEEENTRYAVLPHLLSKSCERYPSYLELSKRLAELYGATLTPSVSKMGENLVLRLAMTVLESKYTFDREDVLISCAELLCQVVFHPHLEDGVFPLSDVQREQRLGLERLEAEKNDKRSYALDRCIEIMCETEPYKANQNGTEEGYQSLTPVSTVTAWRELLERAFIQANIVGTTNADKICGLVQNELNCISRTEPALDLSAGFHPDCEGEKRVTECQEVAQGKLVMGFRTGMTSDRDYPAFRVLADLFGGAPYSRLFKNVREKQSLCYYCSSRLFGKKGILLVQSGVENENANQVVSSVLAELEGLAKGAITQEDMDNSHKALKDGFRSASDTPEEIDGWAYLQLCNESFLSPQEMADALEKVTAEEVAAAAKTLKLDTVFFLEGTKTEEDPADE